jgi:ABC-type Co2+ transport system permease subunit
MCSTEDVCSAVAELLQLCCRAVAGALAMRDDCFERAWPGGVAAELLQELYNLIHRQNLGHL